MSHPTSINYNVLISCCSIALGLLAGCASTDQAVHVDPAGPRTLTAGRGITMQDWYKAASAMIESLRDKFINAGLLQTPPDKPALLVISRIVDKTRLTTPVERIDTDLLVKKIRVDLLQAGKGRIVTSTTIGIGGAEDPIAQEEQRRMALYGLDPSRPDYTLSGKIIEQQTRVGNSREVSYVFQLSLTKNPEGFAVWEDEETVTKESRRARVRP